MFPNTPSLSRKTKIIDGDKHTIITVIYKDGDDTKFEEYVELEMDKDHYDYYNVKDYFD